MDIFYFLPVVNGGQTLVFVVNGGQTLVFVFILLYLYIYYVIISINRD